MNKDVDMGVSGDQRREMSGCWILGIYNPRVTALLEETKWAIGSIAGLRAGKHFFPFALLDHKGPQRIMVWMEIGAKMVRQTTWVSL